MIEFDAEKDSINQAKHGLSLAQAADMTVEIILPDPFADESRFRAFGLIDGQTCCLVFTRRNGRMRAISLRRSHQKEYGRHVRRE
jgi:uncharacterized protein